MDLTTITVSQFQSQFFRDFSYLDAITYSPTQLYNAGTEVYYSPTLLFYTAQQNGLVGVEPDTNPSKWQVTADSINNYVLDQDILNAFAEAQMVYNQGFFGTNITLPYLYLTAHYLCNDLRAAQQGLNSTGAFPVSGRSVGSVSENYMIPDTYKDNPNLAPFTSTAYGMKYLSFLLPNLVGNVNVVWGGANA